MYRIGKDSRNIYVCTYEKELEKSQNILSWIFIDERRDKNNVKEEFTNLVGTCQTTLRLDIGR